MALAWKQFRLVRVQWHPPREMSQDDETIKIVIYQTSQIPPASWAFRASRFDHVCGGNRMMPRTSTVNAIRTAQAHDERGKIPKAKNTQASFLGREKGFQT